MPLRSVNLKASAMFKSEASPFPQVRVPGKKVCHFKIAPYTPPFPTWLAASMPVRTDNTFSALVPCYFIVTQYRLKSINNCLKFTLIDIAA